MAKRYTLECVVCGKKEYANDIQDIRQLHWKVLAWLVPSGSPRCVCSSCEYNKPKTKVK